MADDKLVKKLGIRPGHDVLVLNAPAGYLQRLEGVPVVEGGDGPFDVVQAFVEDGARLAKLAPVALAACRPDGRLWICYRKGTSDVSRDNGWSPMFDAGYRIVSVCAVDEIWSAARFRPGREGEETVDQLFTGAKAALRPLYDAVAEILRDLGSDVTLGARKTYVSASRGQQFAVAAPSSRSRLDVGLRLPGHGFGGRLEDPKGRLGSGSITHRVALTDPSQVDDELRGWLREAYDAARPGC